MTDPRVSPLVPAATARPQPQVAARIIGSVRRSSHVTVRWASGTPGDQGSDVEVHGAVRDVRTDAEGAGVVVGEVALTCTVAPDRTVTTIRTDPPVAGLDALIGVRAHRGWRAEAARLAAPRTRLGALLDDVPIAVVLSSYGSLRRGTIDLGAVAPLVPRMRDVCAGWASDATLMRTVDSGGRLPIPGLVPVPTETGADPLATEQRPTLAPGELRRARRLDVVPGDPVIVQADFRDVWHDPVLGEGALHEYVVTARLTADLVVDDIDADARVLPYRECSVAAASPRLLIGRRVDDVPETVKASAGTSTCTHLNDLLRTLVAVPDLLCSG